MSCTSCRGWSLLQKKAWSQISPLLKIFVNIPPQGVSFWDFICIFAMPCWRFACFSYCTTKLSATSDMVKSRAQVAQGYINFSN